MVDDDDRPAGYADPAHFRSKARRVGHNRGDVERQHRIEGAVGKFEVLGVHHLQVLDMGEAEGAWPGVVLSPASRSRHRSRSPANRAGNEAVTNRYRHRLRESAVPDDHSRCARRPCARDGTPARKRCRRSQKTGDRSGSYRASPSSCSRCDRQDRRRRPPHRLRSWLVPDALVKLTIECRGR